MKRKKNPFSFKGRIQSFAHAFVGLRDMLFTEHNAWVQANPAEFQRQQAIAGLPAGWTTREGPSGEVIGRPPGADWEQVVWQPQPEGASATDAGGNPYQY